MCTSPGVVLPTGMPGLSTWIWLEYVNRAFKYVSTWVWLKFECGLSVNLALRTWTWPKCEPGLSTWIWLQKVIWVYILLHKLTYIRPWIVLPTRMRDLSTWIWVEHVNLASEYGCIYCYINLHTYIYIYIYIYYRPWIVLPTRMRDLSTWISVWIPIHKHTCMQFSAHTCLCAYLHTFLHSCIHSRQFHHCKYVVVRLVAMYVYIHT